MKSEYRKQIYFKNHNVIFIINFRYVLINNIKNLLLYSIKKILKKLVKLENSLMVQWLTSLTSTAGFQVRSLLSELRPWKLHHVVKKERKK